MQGTEAERLRHVVIVTVSSNEVATMPLVCAELGQAIAALEKQGLTAEVILVDDKSPDGTAELARHEADMRGFELTVDKVIRTALVPRSFEGFSEHSQSPNVI